MADFRRVISIRDLPPGGGVPVAVAGREIALFNLEGVFYAVDNICPHRGAPLAEGALVGSSVICPRHRWEFNLKTGANPVSPDLSVRTFPIELRDGDVWVDVGPENGV